MKHTNEFKKLNILFVQSVKGGVGKTYVSICAVKELVKCDKTNCLHKDCTSFTDKNTLDICPKKRAIYIDLDFNGTSLADGTFNTIEGSGVVQHKWSEEVFCSDNYTSQVCSYSSLCDIYNRQLEKGLPVSKLKSITSLDTPILYIDSGRPEGTVGDALFDPMHAEWMCHLLLEIMGALRDEWVRNDETRKIYFVLDNPPGFSQLGPLLLDYVLKYNGLRYTKMCFVLSQDIPDINATVYRLKNLSEMWKKIKNAVKNSNIDPSQTIDQVTKEQLVKDGYWRELMNNDFKVENMDWDFPFAENLYVINNKSDMWSAASVNEFFVSDNTLHEILTSNNMDYVPYEYLLSRSYTQYKRSLCTLQHIDDANNVSDLLDWLQNKDYILYDLSSSLLDEGVSLRLSFFRYLFVLISQISPITIDKNDIKTYLEKYKKYMIFDMKTYRVTGRIGEGAKYVEAGEHAVLEILSKKNVKWNILNDEQFALLVAAFGQPIADLLRYYLNMVLSIALKEDLLGSEPDVIINKAVTQLTYVKTPESYLTILNQTILNNSMLAFFQMVDEKSIVEKYDILTMLLKKDDIDVDLQLFVKNNIFHPHFSLSTLNSAVSKDVFIIPAAVSRMIKYFGR